jgi:hypothetical protein
MQITSRRRRAETGFRVALLHQSDSTRSAEGNGKAADASLFFRAPNPLQPRNPAGDKISLAADFLQKQPAAGCGGALNDEEAPARSGFSIKWIAASPRHLQSSEAISSREAIHARSLRRAMRSSQYWIFPLNKP